MSALTDRIAAEHYHIIGVGVRDGCSCERWEGTSALGFRAHLTAVTEAAVREQVARDIEAELTIGGVTSYEGDEAARIARGTETSVTPSVSAQ